MEISNFKMVTTPEQSRIVQEFLFKNGCRWILDPRKKNKLKYLDSSEIQVDNNIIFTGWFNTEDIPELTFEQFKELYMKESLNTQVGGNHYQKLAIQPIEFIVKNNIPFLEANIIKYVVRHKDKNGLEDLNKAKHYLEMLIENYDTNK